MTDLTDLAMANAEIKRLRAERRQAVRDIYDMEQSLPCGVSCYYCGHYLPGGGDGKCGDICKFEWRGMKGEANGTER